MVLETIAIPIQAPENANAALAHQTALFADPHDRQHDILSNRIQRTLKQRPYVRGCPVQNAFGYSSLSTNGDLQQSVQRYLDGTFSLPRFEDLHLFLMQELPRTTSSLTYIDNGPGVMFFSSLFMAEFGDQVFVKEPERAHHGTWHRAFQDWIPQELTQRIHLLETLPEIEVPTPAEIVYWSHPNPYMMIGASSNPKSRASDDPAAYLGRDVKPGGFLVLQTDARTYQALEFPANSWEPVYESSLHTVDWPNDFVLPTEYYSHPAALRVLRRRA